MKKKSSFRIADFAHVQVARQQENGVSARQSELEAREQRFASEMEAKSVALQQREEMLAAQEQMASSKATRTPFLRWGSKENTWVANLMQCDYTLFSFCILSRIES